MSEKDIVETPDRLNASRTETFNLRAEVSRSHKAMQDKDATILSLRGQWDVAKVAINRAVDVLDAFADVFTELNTKDGAHDAALCTDTSRALWAVISPEVENDIPSTGDASKTEDGNTELSSLRGEVERLTGERDEWREACLGHGAKADAAEARAERAEAATKKMRERCALVPVMLAQSLSAQALNMRGAAKSVIEISAQKLHEIADLIRTIDLESIDEASPLASLTREG
tara:strand:- start:1366 stop:2055 length:690 start_codon:yes stop_codon:yes gene_type:complete